MAKKRKTSRFRGKVVPNLKQREQRASAYGYLNLPKGVAIFKEKPASKIRLDFLPYIVTDDKHPDANAELGIAQVGEQWFKRPFKIHRNVGVNNESVVCPTSFGKRCPICEYRAKLLKEGQSTKEELSALKAKDRVLYNVVPINDDKFEEKPHLWDISPFNFEDLLNEELKEDENYEVFPDLEEGYTLYVRFSSETFGGSNPFGKASKINFEDRDEAYDESILDEVTNLDEVLQEKSYKEIETMFFEMDDVETTDEDVVDEDNPVVPVPTRKRKKKKVEEDNDEEPEEEEKPKPTRRKKKKIKEEVEEEEEEEVEEEEEEEEEKPKRTRTRTRKSKPKPEDDDTWDDEDDDTWDDEDDDTWDDEDE